MMKKLIYIAGGNVSVLESQVLELLKFYHIKGIPFALIMEYRNTNEKGEIEKKLSNYSFLDVVWFKSYPTYQIFDEEKYKKAIGVDALFGEKGYSTLERNSCRPSFDICGSGGGYTGEGRKTVLPSKAYAKVSTRLVPHQDHAKISQMFEETLA